MSTLNRPLVRGALIEEFREGTEGGGGGALRATAAMASSRDPVEFSRKNMFHV